MLRCLERDGPPVVQGFVAQPVVLDVQSDRGGFAGAAVVALSPDQSGEVDGVHRRFRRLLRKAFVIGLGGENIFPAVFDPGSDLERQPRVRILGADPQILDQGVTGTQLQRVLRRRPPHLSRESGLRDDLQVGAAGPSRTPLRAVLLLGHYLRPVALFVVRRGVGALTRVGHRGRVRPLSRPDPCHMRNHHRDEQQPATNHPPIPPNYASHPASPVPRGVRLVPRSALHPLVQLMQQPRQFRDLPRVPAPSCRT